MTCNIRAVNLGNLNSLIQLQLHIHVFSYFKYGGWVLNLLRVSYKLRHYYQVPILVKSRDCTLFDNLMFDSPAAAADKVTPLAARAKEFQPSVH